MRLVVRQIRPNLARRRGIVSNIDLPAINQNLNIRRATTNGNRLPHNRPFRLNHGLASLTNHRGTNTTGVSTRGKLTILRTKGPNTRRHTIATSNRSLVNNTMNVYLKRGVRAHRPNEAGFIHGKLQRRSQRTRPNRRNNDLPHGNGPNILNQIKGRRGQRYIEILSRYELNTLSDM